MFAAAIFGSIPGASLIIQQLGRSGVVATILFNDQVTNVLSSEDHRLLLEMETTETILGL